MNGFTKVIAFISYEHNYSAYRYDSLFPEFKPDFVLEIPGLSEGDYLLLWRYGQHTYMRTLPVLH